VEEAPAPFLDADTREAIHQAAVRAAKSVGYYNAGTAEFLVKGKEFYFLEINTRIQVEHPVTETITGVDLVQLQLKVAMGERIPFEQEEIRFDGHAIELRINAEDTLEGFRPATGRITAFDRVPAPHVREDSGYANNDVVPPYYDSLVSKVIVSGADRAEALHRAYVFLRTYRLEGIPTTVPFHVWILSRPEFQGNGIDIGFVERTFSREEALAAQRLHALDTSHKESDDECSLPAERVYVQKAKRLVPVDLVHERGGTFLAIPLSPAGTPLSTDSWRRSNRKSAAIEAIRALDL
jgi:acetyl-CoA carboxylase biotin carboxylase subunit